MLYDGDCYRVGAPGKRVVPLASRGDLVALNNFQCLNADDAIYFQSEALASGHLAEFAKVIRLRRRDRGVVIEAPSTQPGDNSSLLHTYQADIPYRPNFSFLSLLRKRRGDTGDVSQLDERNPEVAKLFEEYRREVSEGTSKRGFLDYFTAHSFAKAGLPLPSFVRDPRG